MNDVPAANANTSNPHDDMHRDLIHLLQIRHELQLAVSFLDGMDLQRFQNDELHQHAVAMAIAQVEENVKKLSRSFIDSQPAITWRAIAGTRDWIVHDYGNLDFVLLYESVTNESGAILNVIEQTLSNMDIPDDSPGDLGAQALASARQI